MAHSSTPRALPITILHGKHFYIDERLCELRNVNDPADTIRFESQQELRHYQYWTEFMQIIVGKRVTRAEMVHDESFDEMRPVLTFEDGRMIELLSDEEGNGPGCFQYLN